MANMPSSPGTGGSPSGSRMVTPLTWSTWTTTEENAIMSMHNPPHPDEIVRQQCL